MRTIQTLVLSLCVVGLAGPNSLLAAEQTQSTASAIVETSHTNTPAERPSADEPAPEPNPVWAEFNEWRRRSGLPQIKEDPEMSKFAQNKANWRAFYRQHDNHKGPVAIPPGWREGCGEATPDWGWLSCCQEEDAVAGGAGMTIGPDGERYMVLLLRGGTGRALCSRDNSPVHNTSGMNPRPWRIPRNARSYKDAVR